MSARVLVAGVGNVFFHDDAFGVEVLRHLNSSTLPSGVRVMDAGIRGMHLAFEITSGYDAVILVDAISRGDSPGTVSVLEPSRSSNANAADAHSMELESVFAFIERLGGSDAKIVIVGCEPVDVTEGMGLSPQVSAAVPQAARFVERLVSEVIA